MLLAAAGILSTKDVFVSAMGGLITEKFRALRTCFALLQVYPEKRSACATAPDLSSLGEAAFAHLRVCMPAACCPRHRRTRRARTGPPSWRRSSANSPRYSAARRRTALASTARI